jgi:hypothetical protein
MMHVKKFSMYHIGLTRVTFHKRGMPSKMKTGVDSMDLYAKGRQDAYDPLDMWVGFDLRKLTNRQVIRRTGQLNELRDGIGMKLRIATITR